MSAKRPTKADKAKRHPLTDKALNKLKDKFDFGKGVELVIGSANEKTGEQEAKYFFSNKFPKIEINAKYSAKRSIAVEVSSVEQDNKELLHNLFLKIRKS